MSKPKSTKKSNPKLTKWDKVYDDQTVEAIVDEFDRAFDEGRLEFVYPQRGRPSLTGERAESPTVGFRLTPELRERAAVAANREGISLSALARRALEDYLARTP